MRLRIRRQCAVCFKRRAVKWVVHNGLPILSRSPNENLLYLCERCGLRPEMKCLSCSEVCSDWNVYWYSGGMNVCYACVRLKRYDLGTWYWIRAERLTLFEIGSERAIELEIWLQRLAEVYK